MRTGHIAGFVSLILLLGFVGLSSAAIVTDPTGDAIGPTDITAIWAEQMRRGDGIDVLKVSYTATPNLGGILVFEADVDSNAGTGGTLSMTGIPVAPCPCKTTAGIDVAIIMLNRDQDENSALPYVQAALIHQQRRALPKGITVNGMLLLHTETLTPTACSEVIQIPYPILIQPESATPFLGPVSWFMRGTRLPIRQSNMITPRPLTQLQPGGS